MVRLTALKCIDESRLRSTIGTQVQLETAVLSATFAAATLWSYWHAAERTITAADAATLARSTMVMTCMHSRTCLHSTLTRQSVKLTAIRPHRTAVHRTAVNHSSAWPAGWSQHAVRQSGRCRAADSGNDEQGEPQQQLKQVTEDVKQQAEEATQGTSISRRSLYLAGLMWMCLLISRSMLYFAWLFPIVLHHRARLELDGVWCVSFSTMCACRWREDAGFRRQPHHVDAAFSKSCGEVLKQEISAVRTPHQRCPLLQALACLAVPAGCLAVLHHGAVIPAKRHAAPGGGCNDGDAITVGSAQVVGVPHIGLHFDLDSVVERVLRENQKRMAQLADKFGQQVAVTVTSLAVQCTYVCNTSMVTPWVAATIASGPNSATLQCMSMQHCLLHLLPYSVLRALSLRGHQGHVMTEISTI